MTTLRRFLGLCALLFWQGGFTFYAAVVVPIAGQVLPHGSHFSHWQMRIPTVRPPVVGRSALIEPVWYLAKVLHFCCLKHTRSQSHAELEFTQKL